LSDENRSISNLRIGLSMAYPFFHASQALCYQTTFAWIGQHRRLVRDEELIPQGATAWGAPCHDQSLFLIFPFFQTVSE